MRRLTDQVSVDEMLKMREAGMTNQDIANSLNASVITVRRYIGTQAGNRSRRMETPVRATAAPVPAPALAVSNRVTYLEGAVAEYTVDTKSETVLFQAKGTEACVGITFDQWEAFCQEVQAIQRYLSKENPEVS